MNFKIDKSINLEKKNFQDNKLEIKDTKRNGILKNTFFNSITNQVMLLLRNLQF